MTSSFGTTVCLQCSARFELRFWYLSLSRRVSRSYASIHSACSARTLGTSLQKTIINRFLCAHSFQWVLLIPFIYAVLQKCRAFCFSRALYWGQNLISLPQRGKCDKAKMCKTHYRWRMRCHSQASQYDMLNRRSKPLPYGSQEVAHLSPRDSPDEFLLSQNSLRELLWRNPPLLR